MHEHTRYRLRSSLKVFILLIVIALLMIPLAGILLFVFEVEDSVICEGEVSPEEEYEIVSHLSGRLMSLNVHTGQKVSKGDVLAVIDSTEFENSLITLQSEIRQLEAEQSVAQVALANEKADPLPQDLWHAETNLQECREKEAKAKDKLERYTRLLEQNAVAKVDLENIELEYIEAEAAL